MKGNQFQFQKILVNGKVEEVQKLSQKFKRTLKRSSTAKTSEEYLIHPHYAQNIPIQ